MAKRVALIPEELVSSYHLQKPEMRIEDEMESLLEKSKLPDDMKVKLLSYLITRYHKTMHAPPEPVPVSISNDLEQYQRRYREDSVSTPESDSLLKDIIFTVPQRSQKYIPMIVEKLKSRNYSWNAWGEMTRDEKPIEGSKMVDYFSYIMRNGKTLREPRHFDSFLRAIKEINIPRTWIVNKKVLKYLENETPHSSLATTFDISDAESPLFIKRRRNSSSSIREKKSPFEFAHRRSRSITPRKWVEY